MEDIRDFVEGRLYVSITFAVLFMLIALPLQVEAHPGENALRHTENIPDNPNIPFKTAQNPWVSQNLVNDSEFTAGGFGISKWNPELVQLGLYGDIEHAEDKAEYISDGGSGYYMLLQAHDDVEEPSFYEDLGESVGIVQMLPESLYFANKNNITVDVSLQFRFRSTGGAGSLKLMTIAYLQIGIHGEFKTIASVERSGTSHSAYDSGVQTVKHIFDMGEQAYINGYKTNFNLEIRIVVESVAFGQYVTAEIDNVYVFCDASSDFNPDFYKINNNLKQASIVKDGKFTRGYWDPTNAWAADIIESGGTTNGIEKFRHADWVFYDKEYNYSESGEVQNQKSKLELQLKDNYGSGPDAYEMAYIEQILPSFYFADPGNLSFQVILKYQLTITSKSQPELHNLRVGVEIGDEWVQDLQHSSNGVSAYDSGEREALITFNMVDQVLANSYSTAYPFRVILKGSTAGNHIATLRVISVEVYCDFSLSQAPIIGRAADIAIDAGENAEISWLVTDSITNIRQYLVYLNENLLNGGTWESGDIITQSVTSLEPGIHVMKLVVMDGLGGITTDIVLIDVISAEPPPNNPGENPVDTPDGRSDSDRASTASQQPAYMIPMILGLGLAAGVSTMVAARRMYHVHPSDIKRKRLPYRPIQQHIQKLSSQSKELPLGVQNQDELQLKVNQLRINAQGAFAEGAYLEAIALYNQLIQTLKGLNMKEELHATQIKLTFLQQAVKEKDYLIEKIESAVAQEIGVNDLEQLYYGLMVACRKLNDLSSVEYYITELKKLKGNISVE
jgi:hypothetical protein